MSTIIPITDFSAPELDLYARYSESQLLHLYEPNGGIFIAESPNVVKRAIAAGYEPISILVEDKQIDKEAKEILTLAKDILIYTAPFDVLTQLTGFKLTRGLLCALKRKPLPTPKEICINATRIAVLEDVVNPTNVGAIFRNAAALNIDAILLTSACSNPFYRRSLRVSMGTAFQIPWTYLPDSKTSLPSDMQSLQGDSPINSFLHQMGYKTVAMALRKNSYAINAPLLKQEKKLAILLGTEGEGLASSTISHCDYTVCIPMSHGVDSLNVAAASAIAFWELGHN